MHLEKAIELLSDGKWHDYNRILTAVTAAVHPSRGYRHARMSRKHDPIDDAERQRMVRTGQRAIARVSLSRKQRFERRNSPDGTRQIRFLGYLPLSEEERHSRAQKGAKTLSPDMRSQRALKGWETRRGRQ